MTIKQNGIEIKFYTRELIENVLNRKLNPEDVAGLGFVDIGHNLFVSALSSMYNILNFLISDTFDTALPQKWFEENGYPRDYVWLYPKNKGCFGEPHYIGDWKERLLQVAIKNEKYLPRF